MSARSSDSPFVSRYSIARRVRMACKDKGCIYHIDNSMYSTATNSVCLHINLIVSYDTK